MAVSAEQVTFSFLHPFKLRIHPAPAKISRKITAANIENQRPTGSLWTVCFSMFAAISVAGFANKKMKEEAVRNKWRL